MAKFYNAMDDRVFKNIIMTKGGHMMLKKIISIVLNREVKEIKLLNKDLKSKNRFVRGKTVDVLVEDENEKVFIEINNAMNDYIRIRNFGYLCSAYGNDVMRGEKYNVYKNYVQINLSRKSLTGNLRSDYRLIDECTNKSFVDNMLIIEYDMERIENICYNSDIKSLEDLRYFGALIVSKDKLVEISKGDEILSEFNKELKQLNSDDEFTEWISVEEDMEKMKRSFMDDTTKRLTKEITEKVTEEVTNKVTEEVTNKVTEEVTNKVTEEVTNKVTKEVTKKVTQDIANNIKSSIAKQMLIDGNDLESISKYTGLSIDEINKI